MVTRTVMMMAILLSCVPVLAVIISDKTYECVNLIFNKAEVPF